VGMGEFGPWHLLIVATLFVLLFGSKKLPDAARSAGRSLRIFKAEMRSMRDDDASQAEASRRGDRVGETDVSETR
jgi:sec-independent protein translocase protein TatA